MKRILISVSVLLALTNLAQASNYALINISNIKVSAISGSDFAQYTHSPYTIRGMASTSLNDSGDIYSYMWSDGFPITVTSDGGGKASTYASSEYNADGLIYTEAVSYAEAANSGSTNLGGVASAGIVTGGDFFVGNDTTVTLGYDVYGFVNSEIGPLEDIATISYSVSVFKINEDTYEWHLIDDYDYSLSSTSFGNQSNQISETLTPFTLTGLGIYRVSFNISAYAYKSPTLVAKPVPEPSNLAMLFGGLGLIGMLRRSG
jgi:hypothetical protein